MNINPASGIIDYLNIPKYGPGTHGGNGASKEDVDLGEQIQAMRLEMFNAAEALEFEKAARLRDELKKLQALAGGGRASGATESYGSLHGKPEKEHHAHEKRERAEGSCARGHQASAQIQKLEMSRRSQIGLISAVFHDVFAAATCKLMVKKCVLFWCSPPSLRTEFLKISDFFSRPGSRRFSTRPGSKWRSKPAPESAAHHRKRDFFGQPWTLIRLENKTKAGRFERTAGGFTTFFYALRIERGFVGVVLRGGEEDQIVPVEWLCRVVAVGFADATATRNWYVAMSQRLATTGKGERHRRAGDRRRHGDRGRSELSRRGEELVARLKFLRAGEYKADEWGPRIDGAVTVSVGTMNGHDGISIQDILRQQLTPPHPQELTFLIGVRVPHPRFTCDHRCFAWKSVHTKSCREVAVGPRSWHIS